MAGMLRCRSYPKRNGKSGRVFKVGEKAIYIVRLWFQNDFRASSVAFQLSKGPRADTKYSLEARVDQ